MSEQLKTRHPNDASSDKSAIKVSADDFKGRAIDNAVLKESLQHPATIYPLVGSALALGWTAIIAPTPVSLAVSFGLAFISGSAFVYNYILKGPERAQAYVAKLREARRAQALLRLDQIADRAETLGFPEASKEARELKAAYQDLARYLTEHKERVSADRFRVLAEDSLKQGIAVLERALLLCEAMESVNVNALWQEIEAWKRQQLNIDSNSPGFRMLGQQIDSHTQRINLYVKEKEKLTELVAESNNIESALQTTYLELVEMGDEGADQFLSEGGGAANRLRSAVEVAKRVEEKLRGGENGELEAKKSKYLQAPEPNN